MELPMTDRIADGQEHHRHITASYNLAFGKWFSPYLAWRIGATYGAYHVDAVGYNKAKYLNANVDLMWDMFNSFGSVKSDRFLSVIPFVGVGVSRSWGWSNQELLPQTQHGAVKGRIWEFPVSMGLQLRFRLCKYVDFFAEGRFGLFGDEFDGAPIGQNVDMNLNVLGGFNINFGGREFKSFNPCDYLGYMTSVVPSLPAVLLLQLPRHSSPVPRLLLPNVLMHRLRCSRPYASPSTLPRLLLPRLSMYTTSHSG